MKQRLEKQGELITAYDRPKHSHYEFLLANENRALFKLLIDVLEQRGNSPGCIVLKQKAIGFLTDVVKLGDFVVSLFVE